MNINENARVVLEKRYLEKNEKCEPVETVDGMFLRVASAIAASDRLYEPEADPSLAMIL